MRSLHTPEIPPPDAEVINCNSIICMRKLLLLLLFGAIFGACSDKKVRPVLVTDIVMPPETWVFTPGDGVTVSAESFEENDEIMFEICWEEGAEGFAPNGYARGVRGIVTSRTAASITFLAPGHYPASTTTVLLLRSGRLMPLGNIRVADGIPKTAALYGITEYDTDETTIDRIDLETGAETRVKTLGIGRGITCAVGIPGSGWIYGVYSGSMTGFDLTMNYYNDFGYQDYLFIGQVSDSAVALLSYDAGRLRLTTQSVTRTSYPAPLSWDMPEEVVQQLAVQPFVRAGSDLLLTLCNGDGTCTPLSLSVSGGSGLGKTVGADAMVPFWTVVASDEPDKFYQVGGYAVSKDGVTQLRLFNASGDGTFGETLAEVPGTVLSVTEYAPDSSTLEIYLLCEADGVRRIHIYDALRKTQRTLPGEFGCSQIVAAK